MEKNFSFDSIGKRMPYRMPDSFMQNLEQSVMQQVCAETHSKVKRGGGLVAPAFRSVVAAAAVATLFIVCRNVMQPSRNPGYDEIYQAFDNLSYEDQKYMIDTYANDAFAYVGDYDSY